MYKAIHEQVEGKTMTVDQYNQEHEQRILDLQARHSGYVELLKKKPKLEYGRYINTNRTKRMEAKYKRGKSGRTTF